VPGSSAFELVLVRDQVAELDVGGAVEAAVGGLVGEGGAVGVGGDGVVVAVWGWFGG